MLSQNSLQKLFTSNYVSFCFSLKFIENHNILDPRNAHEKKSWTHEIPTRKNLRPTKHPREKFSDQRRHDGTVVQDLRDPRWHRSTEFSTLCLSTFSLGGVSTGICRPTVFWFMLVRYHKFKLSTQIEYTSFASVILWVFSCKKISE